MFCKGEITLYDWDYRVLVSGSYESKREALLLYDKWLERYQSQAHHFIIRPIASAFINENKPVYKNINGHIENIKHYKTRSLVADKKVEVIRPLAEYGNSKSSFGIADELHKKKQ